MNITSKILTQIRWKEAGIITAATIVPGKHGYNTIPLNDVMVRMQLYALHDAKLLDFDPKVDRPTEDELKNYWCKKPETLEVENVRTVETPVVGVGGVGGTDGSRWLADLTHAARSAAHQRAGGGWGVGAVSTAMP